MTNRAVLDVRPKSHRAPGQETGDNAESQAAQINETIALVGQPSTDFVERAANELMAAVEW
jgi:hypothetical protein